MIHRNAAERYPKAAATVSARPEFPSLAAYRKETAIEVEARLTKEKSQLVRRQPLLVVNGVIKAYKQDGQFYTSIRNKSYQNENLLELLKDINSNNPELFL